METNNEIKNRYSLEQYLIPLWESAVVYNESIMPLENPDGTLDPIRLLYPAEQIRCVSDALLEIVYKEGSDYRLEDGKLVILPDGAIPTISYRSYYPEEAIPHGTFPRTGGGYVAFSEGPAFHKMQLAVTYTHSGAWDGPIPPAKGRLLSEALSKLENGQPFKILLYGDSITVGANASGFVGAPPFMPCYGELVTEALRRQYRNAEIYSVNTAKGGMGSHWGVTHAEDLAAVHAPDLAVIAFGMNDGAPSIHTPPEIFAENIKTIMDAIRRTAPSCAFVLVSTMLPNYEASDFPGTYEAFLPYLLQLEASVPGTAVADMTSIHRYLLTRKRYCDMTGNNVNHPNDFLSRFYAQVILAALS